MPISRRFRVELIRRSDLSPRVQSLRFRARQPFEWVAGQHVELLSPAGGTERFFYSIASTMDVRFPGEFELAVARGGSAGILERIATGTELEAEGPSGSLIWQPPATGSVLFIGVGTGVAPLRALIHEEVARGGDATLLLLCGYRTESDVLWADELGALPRRHPRFRFEPTLSQASNTWDGRRGRVQEHIAELIEPFGDDTFVYVCGRSAMVVDVTSSLRERYGISAPRIRGEGY